MVKADARNAAQSAGAGGADAFVFVVAIGLAVLAVATTPVLKSESAVSRIFVLLGGVLCAAGGGSFYRRCYGALPPEDEEGPFATLLFQSYAQWAAAPTRLFTSLLGGVLAFVARFASARLEPIGVGLAGLGAFSRGFSALALLVGSSFVATKIARHGGSIWPYPFLACSILLVIESSRTLEMVVTAYVLRPARTRVRFEIGGLGTRVEDMTPKHERDVSGGEALAMLGFGLLLVFLGSGINGVLMAVMGIATYGGIASAVACLGSPVLIVAFAALSNASPLLAPFLAPILAFATFADAQRVAVHGRVSPRAVAQVFIAAAVVTAIVRGVMNGLPPASPSGRTWNEGSDAWMGALTLVGVFAIVLVLAALVYIVRRATAAASAAERSPVAPSALHPGNALSEDLFGLPTSRSRGLGSASWTWGFELLAFCPLAPLALGLVSPWPFCAAYALGALVGRFARGRSANAQKPRLLGPVDLVAAGAAIAGLIAFALSRT